MKFCVTNFLSIYCNTFKNKQIYYFFYYYYFFFRPIKPNIQYTHLHSSRFFANVCQFIFGWNPATSLLTQSSQHSRGLPKGHYPLGSSCKMVFTRASVFLQTWPAHSSLFIFIIFSISGLLYRSLSSILCLLHYSFFCGLRYYPYILHNIFLLKPSVILKT